MNTFNQLMYILCIVCVVWNGWIFLTTGSLIALAFGGLCAFSLWGRQLIAWWERRK